MTKKIKIPVFNKAPYKWYEIKKIFQHYCSCFKYAYQRIRYGYCDRDVWNFDHYLSNIIYNGLTDLAQNHNGYPSVLVYNGLSQEEANKAWADILNEIAQSFYYSQEENYKIKSWDKYYDLKYNKKLSPDNKKLQKALEDYLNEKKQQEAEQDMYKEKGFKMLNEWFYDLWD